MEYLSGIKIIFPLILLLSMCSESEQVRKKYPSRNPRSAGEYFPEIKKRFATFPDISSFVEDSFIGERTLYVLKRHLLSEYNNNTVPGNFKNKENFLKFDINLKHVNLEENENVVTVFGWLRMQWTDERLRWNKSNFDEINTIHVAPHEIWHPDVATYYTADNLKDDDQHFGTVWSIIYNDGVVLRLAPFKIKQFCDLDLRFWPKDRHACKLTFRSSNYSIGEFKFNWWNDIEPLMKDPKWIIRNLRRNKIQIDAYENQIKLLTYEFDLERNTKTQTYLVVIHAISVVVLTLTNFCLPPNRNEKILINSIVLIMICTFISYFTNKMPNMAIHTPLIVLFYSTALLLVSISIGMSSILIFLLSGTHQKPVPICIRNLLAINVIKIIFRLHYDIGDANKNCIVESSPSSLDAISSITQEKNAEKSNNQNINGIHQEEEESFLRYGNEVHKIAYEWIIVVTAIEKFLFILHSLIFLGFVISFMLEK